MKPRHPCAERRAEAVPVRATQDVGREGVEGGIACQALEVSTPFLPQDPKTWVDVREHPVFKGQASTAEAWSLDPELYRARRPKCRPLAGKFPTRAVAAEAMAD